MKSGAGNLRFAVIQMGARLHYAAPAALERAGALQVLYTDAHADSRGAGLFRPLGALPGGKGIRRLLSRRIPPGIPPGKVRSWMRPAFQIEWFNRRHPELRKRARGPWERQLGGHWLAQRAIAEDFGGANALYAHPCSCTDAVREAKRRGMYVVIEAISHPSNKFVEKAEYERFGLPGPEPETELRENLDFFREEIALADMVLAASPYVRDGLIELGVDPARIALVPYGLDSGFFDATPAPVPGRVLYVGNIGYLKGVPHLAEAARQLQAEGFAGEIRAVGPHDGRLIQRPEFAGPRYVGQVPRSEVKREFLEADLFAFPTLSDGFGVVLLEAMAAGLPIVCTPNCADVVRNDVSGFIVPAGDAGALAAGIRRVVSERALRDSFSRNAKRLVQDFSLDAYARMLASALQRN